MCCRQCCLRILIHMNKSQKRVWLLSSTAMFTDTRTGIVVATRNWSITKGKLHMKSGCRRKSRQVFSTQVLSVLRPAKQRPRSGAKKCQTGTFGKNVLGQRFKTFSFSLQKRFRPFLVWPWNIFSLVLGFAACYWPLTRSLRKCNGHDSIQWVKGEVRGWAFFFERRFQPLSVGEFFSNQRGSISRCPKSLFPSKTQNRQIARTSPLKHVG